MQKITNKILNISLVLMLILNLISYQLVLPTAYSRAEEEIVSESSEPVQEEPAAEEEVVEEEPIEEPAPAIETVEPTNSTLDDSQTAPLAAITTETTESTNPECDCCPCQNNEDNNNEDENCDTPCPTECDNCPTECQTCPEPCCESSVSATNITENASNEASAVSDTGNNAIVENSAPVETIQPATQEENNNDDNDSENNETNNNEDPVATEPTSETTEPEAVILTGDALAEAVAVNAINTNIYTENGEYIVQNIEGDYSGDINLLETFETIIEGAQTLLNDEPEYFEHIDITNINIAENVENSVLASAGSGNNLIDGVAGDATIITGTVQAAASAVNLVNTNITGNNWLFAIINITGNWTGDLIVPGKDLLKTPTADIIFDKITDINIANAVRNFIFASANTGNNSIASAGGDASVESGDAFSGAAGLNLVNTNIASNNWFFLMINNVGRWSGQVLNWNSATQSQDLVYEYEFGQLEDGYQPTKYLSVFNYNYANEVSNTVLASADSGNNTINSAGDSSIATGNAGAWASAMNFVNTNITGNNWFFGVVNNSGNWDGDVVFGYPDLEVSLSADKDALQPGESMNYTLKHKNVGAAKCADAELMLSLPEFFIHPSASESFSSNAGNDFYWSLAGMAPGEERALQFSVQLNSETPRNIISLESVAGVKTSTEEREFSNNYSSDKTNLIFNTVTIGDSGELPETEAGISLRRFEEPVVSIGSIANHSITLNNTGKETVYNLAVKENIKDPAGNTVAEYIWPIQKLKKGQSAFIEYQIFVDPSAMLGDYKHTASAIAYDFYGREIKSKKASGTVAFVWPASGNVGESEITTPPAEDISMEQNLPESILGASTTKEKSPWFWLLALAIFPAAYFFKKKELYRWQNIQRFAEQASGFFSSWF